MMKIQNNRQSIILNEDTLRFCICTDGEEWSFEDNYHPYMILDGEKILFSQAKKILHQEVYNGIGKGILSQYCGFEVNEKKYDFAFETYVWIEEATGDVFFEWIPINEEAKVEHVFWPGPMSFEEKRSDWYTLLTEYQGLLIPNDWEQPREKMVFDGMFGTAGQYMSWFSQIREGNGYIAIALTPWNGRVNLEHPAGGPYTHVSVSWQPSLGKMDYRRIMRYSFRKNCDYNDMCKIYRNYIFENGLALTLNEKATRVPSVDKLIGSAFVHKGIKTSVNPASEFFDPQAPEKNNSLTTFATRQKEMEKLHELGVKKVYLHLDGWAQPGYDNRHPDYLPACEEAGGWEGMRNLAESMQNMGYMFGIHDQYRDFYKDASSYSDDYACKLPDGTIPSHARWAGGPQAYLCATQAPYYVRRNFSEIKKNGIKLDGAYLDVFTCNEGDECDNPRHRMTRRDCHEFRGKCFQYLLNNGILTSSEEVSDWAMNSLVFCHYAPYRFMMEKPGTPQVGVAVPLFNLVYHDCVVEPWMMDKVSEKEDYMLYALLNGGAPYLVRDAAYPNIDGAFTDVLPVTLEEAVERCAVVSELHEKVAKSEMLSHKFLSDDYQVQQTIFADGTKVTINLRDVTYTIE